MQLSVLKVDGRHGEPPIRTPISWVLLTVVFPKNGVPLTVFFPKNGVPLTIFYLKVADIFLGDIVAVNSYNFFNIWTQMHTPLLHVGKQCNTLDHSPDTGIHGFKFNDELQMSHISTLNIGYLDYIVDCLLTNVWCTHPINSNKVRTGSVISLKCSPCSVRST